MQYVFFPSRTIVYPCASINVEIDYLYALLSLFTFYLYLRAFSKSQHSSPNKWATSRKSHVKNFVPRMSPRITWL